MNVLITGGTGFLGWRTAEQLALAGYQVTIASRHAIAPKSPLKKGISYCQMDLRQEQDVLEVCRGQDIVVHCGALSKPWGRYKEFYQTNVLGTKHVIQGCLTQAVKRLIHISSPSIYFDFNHCFNIHENDPLPKTPCNAYAHTKLLAEKEIDRAFHEGLNVVTLRPRGIFGPGDTTIFPRFIEANKKQKMPLINGGKAFVDLTYIDNVVDAILLSIKAPSSVLGKKFNITNGESWTVLQLMESLFCKLGESFCPKLMNYYMAYSAAWGMEFISKYFQNYKEPLLTRYSVGIISKSQTLNIQAAQQELGYCPRIGIEEGLALFAKWWKERKVNQNGC